MYRCRICIDGIVSIGLKLQAHIPKLSICDIKSWRQKEKNQQTRKGDLEGKGDMSTTLTANVFTHLTHCVSLTRVTA